MSKRERELGVVSRCSIVEGHWKKQAVQLRKGSQTVRGVSWPVERGPPGSVEGPPGAADGSRQTGRPAAVTMSSPLRKAAASESPKRSAKPAR